MLPDSPRVFGPPAYSPAISNAKIGAVSFIQQFGNVLNLHPHFHLIVADGIFSTEDDALLFHEAFLTPDDIADTQDSIQNRILKSFLSPHSVTRYDMQIHCHHDRPRQLHR